MVELCGGGGYAGSDLTYPKVSHVGTTTELNTEQICAKPDSDTDCGSRVAPSHSEPHDGLQTLAQNQTPGQDIIILFDQVSSVLFLLVPIKSRRPLFDANGLFW